MMADQHDIDLDSIIDRLLEVRGSRPGKQVQLLEAEIRYLCTKAREIFISQPILLELEAPIKVSFTVYSAGRLHLSACLCLPIITPIAGRIFSKLAVHLSDSLHPDLR
jgi:hypothetical protein